MLFLLVKSKLTLLLVSCLSDKWVPFPGLSNASPIPHFCYSFLISFSLYCTSVNSSKMFFNLLLIVLCIFSVLVSSIPRPELNEGDSCDKSDCVNDSDPYIFACLDQGPNQGGDQGGGFKFQKKTCISGTCRSNGVKCSFN